MLSPDGLPMRGLRDASPVFCASTFVWQSLLSIFMAGQDKKCCGQQAGRENLPHGLC